APQRPRAAHPDRAASPGEPDDPRGSVTAIRHLARAGAADRGARLRETAESDEGGRDRAPPRHALSFNGGKVPLPHCGRGRDPARRAGRGRGFKIKTLNRPPAARPGKPTAPPSSRAGEGPSPPTPPRSPPQPTHP